MIVVGVDPGARDTGIAVVDYTLITGAMPVLVASFTINRPTVPGERIEAVPRAYLATVNAAVTDALVEFDAQGIGCEGVHKPTGHAKGRAGHLIDPGPLLATAQVVGAVVGRMWRVPCFRIDPIGNGHLFPLAAYPDPIGTRGKGNDKRRHERSAFDVAVMAAPMVAGRLEQQRKAQR